MEAGQMIMVSYDDDPGGKWRVEVVVIPELLGSGGSVFAAGLVEHDIPGVTGEYDRHLRRGLRQRAQALQQLQGVNRPAGAGDRNYYFPVIHSS